MTIKEITQYQEKFKHIPKDYLERIKLLCNEDKNLNDHLDKLFSKVEELIIGNWEEINYIFYMIPKSTPRPRARYVNNENTRNKIFYVSNAKDTKSIFDEFMMRHSKLPYVISTPCQMYTKLYLPKTSTMTKLEELAAELELIHCLTTPDWDNLGKTYSDMIRHTLIQDDSILCKVCIEKFYSNLPRIEIKLKFMKDYDCRYNKMKVETRKSFKENPRTIKSLGYIIHK